jgi:hypothetical protein
MTHLPVRHDRSDRPKRPIVADQRLVRPFRGRRPRGPEIAARYRALSQLSTPELARRGLNRYNIARTALTGY